MYDNEEYSEQEREKVSKKALMKSLFNTYLVKGTRAATIHAIGWRPLGLVYVQLHTGYIIGDFSRPNDFYSWWPLFEASGFKVFQFEMRYVSRKWKGVFDNELVALEGVTRYFN